MKEKLAYGSGAVPDIIGFHGPGNLAGPLFIVHFGVSPLLVSLAIALTRIWDGMLDPVMGAVSDRVKWRGLRRRPYILAGALLSGVCFGAMWFVPSHLTEMGKFIFLTLSLLVFYTAFTIYTVPYHALGYEMTAEHHERTSVMAYRLGFNTIGGIIVGWLLAGASSGFFSDMHAGAKAVGVASGVLFLAVGMFPALHTREATPRDNPAPVSLRAIIYDTWSAFGNSQFWPLIAMTALHIVTLTLIYNSFLVYINTAYTFGGDLARAAVLGGTLSLTTSAMGFTMLPIATRLARRWGKKTLLQRALYLQLGTALTSWHGIDPAYPYLQVAIFTIHFATTIVFFLMLHSFVGDICDMDEYVHGERREGSFGAAITWTQKMAVAAGVGLSGIVLSATRFEQGVGALQSEETTLRMRVFFFLFLVAHSVVCLLLVQRLRLNSRLVARMRALVESRGTAEAGSATAGRTMRSRLPS